MKPIVLLTDFGLQDPYAGILKGVILKICPRAVIVDLCHEIGPQDIVRGADQLAIACRYFPKGSIFVAVVDPGVGTSRKILCAQTPDYFFIGPDNGLLSQALAFEKKVRVREISNPDFFLARIPSATFHGRDVMVPAAARLAKAASPGLLFRQMGPVLADYKKLPTRPIRKSRHSVCGEILYFDRYGNAITNIRRGDAPVSFWKKAHFAAASKPMGTISETYATARKKLAVLWNSFDQLEIAAPGSSAQKRGRLQTGDPVMGEIS